MAGDNNFIVGFLLREVEQAGFAPEVFAMAMAVVDEYVDAFRSKANLQLAHPLCDERAGADDKVRIRGDGL